MSDPRVVKVDQLGRVVLRTTSENPSGEVILNPACCCPACPIGPFTLTYVYTDNEGNADPTGEMLLTGGGAYPSCTYIGSHEFPDVRGGTITITANAHKVDAGWSILFVVNYATGSAPDFILCSSNGGDPPLFVVVVETQGNGYFTVVRDGTGEIIAVNPAPPAVVFTGGTGTGLTATANVVAGLSSNTGLPFGFVNSVTVTDQGNNYQGGALPTVSFVSAVGGSGVTALVLDYSHAPGVFSDTGGTGELGTGVIGSFTGINLS